MTELTISMPPALQGWVDTRRADGDYANAADYLRDLVRRDSDAVAMDRPWVRSMIGEGLASRILDDEPEDVLAAIIAEDLDLRD